MKHPRGARGRSCRPLGGSPCGSISPCAFGAAAAAADAVQMLLNSLLNHFQRHRRAEPHRLRTTPWATSSQPGSTWCRAWTCRWAPTLLCPIPQAPGSRSMTPTTGPPSSPSTPVPPTVGSAGAQAPGRPSPPSASALAGFRCFYADDFFLPAQAARRQNT